MIKRRLNDRRLNEWYDTVLGHMKLLDQAIDDGKGLYADLSCRNANVLLRFALRLFYWLDEPDPWIESERIAAILKRYDKLSVACKSMLPKRIDYIIKRLKNYGKNKT